MRNSFVAMAIAAVGVVGCGGVKGPEVATVSGTVTLDGKPLPNVNLQFVPEESGGSPSYGGTNADGKYQLLFNQNRKGAMLGKHRVQITTRERKLDEGGNPIGDEPVKLPAKYAKPDALTAEVFTGGNTVDFQLVSQPEPTGGKVRR